MYGLQGMQGSSGKRSKFSLSNYKLLTCDGGELVPFNLIETLPGDTIQLATSVLLRASPMLAPVMHPVSVRVHHFFVPHRLVWEDFEDFITGGPDGDDASVFPTIALSGTANTVGSLADYLGVPTGVNLTTSALPFRGYNLIFNEWYRDQDLQTAITVSEASGTDTTTGTDLKNVNWEKDYFTSARPWEQKGTGVTIGIGGLAPIKGIGVPAGNISNLGTPGTAVWETGATATTNYNVGSSWEQFDAPLILKMQSTAATAVSATNTPQIYADLSSAGAISINELREALSLQRFQEARARYGSRYTEYLAYLGVQSADARLQRPEYLGGGSNTVQFSEVLQTGVTTSGATAGVGSLRGHGIGALRSNRFRRYFTEHGYIFSFLNVRPKTMYIQGLPRTWNRRVKEDFWQMELQHMGQQAILNKEIYAAHATPEGTFGYQDRYDEYRRQESWISGEFRNSTLNFWHFARAFSSDPALNSDFVSCVPTETPFQVSTTDVYWVMCRNSAQARRKVCQVGTSMTF